MPDRPLQIRARTMRNAPTPFERAVWRILRAAPFDGLHFRRQVPFGGRYIADFASHRARTIIEVDGDTHDLASPDEMARTAWLNAQGYRVIRFSNAQVAEADIARALLHELAGFLPPPPPVSAAIRERGGGRRSPRHLPPVLHAAFVPYRLLTGSLTLLGQAPAPQAPL